MSAAVNPPMYLTTIREKAAESKGLSSRDFSSRDFGFGDAETIYRDNKDVHVIFKLPPEYTLCNYTSFVETTVIRALSESLVERMFRAIKSEV